MSGEQDDKYFASTPTPGSERDRDNQFYSILGGGAKFCLLEGFIDLQLPEFLGKADSPLSAGEICRHMQLDEHRGWKFLHNLALCGFLEESNAEDCCMDAQYSLSDQSKNFFGKNGNEGYFYRELLSFQRYVKDLKIPFVDILKGSALPEMVKWPPQTEEAAIHLETWMTVSSAGAIQRLVDSKCLEDSKTILDVGGGDGTIAIALVKEHLPEDVKLSIYNLPASAELARRNVEYYECSDRVDVIDGNFLEDSDFPGPYDAITFNRVMADWTPAVCKKLMEMSRRSLIPGGKLIINEPLVEGNEDLAICWEYRYIFYDTFGRGVYKKLQTYTDMLEQNGFRVHKVSPMTDAGFYTVIEARSLLV